MNARDQIPAARAKLLAGLGYEPTLTEVAKQVGVSRERVRQLYTELGLDSNKGQREKRAKIHADKATDPSTATGKRTASIARGDVARAKRAEVLRLLRTGAAQVAVAEAVGTPQSNVSRIAITYGERRMSRYTVEEDAQILSGVKRLPGRSRAAIRERRYRLRKKERAC